MVNNTSGAINYLAKTGVLVPATNVQCNDSTTEYNVFSTIYPYTIGAKIHFDELEIYHAIETMMDRTLEFLCSNSKLEISPNSFDYHNLRDKDVKMCLERCDIRNRMAYEMDSEALRWAKEMERRRSMNNKKKKDKAQDHYHYRSPMHPCSSPEPVNKENNNNSSKKKKRTKNNKEFKQL